MLAVRAVEAGEARACTVAEVADTTTRAVTSGFVTVTIERIRTRGALLELASRTTVTSVTEAANMFHSVPRRGVGTARLNSQMTLRPARAAVVTVVRAGRTLASHTVISIEALAGSALAVAGTLVGALHPGVKIVRVDNVTNPSEISRAGAQGAVRTSPLSLTVKACEALAVAVFLAGTVVRAVVLTKTTVAVTALIPSDLSPALGGKGGGGGGPRVNAGHAIADGVGAGLGVARGTGDDAAVSAGAVAVGSARAQGSGDITRHHVEFEVTSLPKNARILSDGDGLVGNVPGATSCGRN